MLERIRARSRVRFVDRRAVLWVQANPHRKDPSMQAPRTPQELRTRLWRYVRHPDFADKPFREAVFKASEQFEVSPYEVFALLGDEDF